MSRNYDRIMALGDKSYAEAALRRSLLSLSVDGDAAAFLEALRDITISQGGVSSLANNIGVNRQNLYRTFSSDGNPKLKSLSSILNGLGYRLSIEPLTAANNDTNDHLNEVKDHEAA